MRQKRRKTPKTLKLRNLSWFPRKPFQRQCGKSTQNSRNMPKTENQLIGSCFAATLSIPITTLLDFFFVDDHACKHLIDSKYNPCSNLTLIICISSCFRAHGFWVFSRTEKPENAGKTQNKFDNLLMKL